MNPIEKVVEVSSISLYWVDSQPCRTGQILYPDQISRLILNSDLSMDFPIFNAAFGTRQMDVYLDGVLGSNVNGETLNLRFPAPVKQTCPLPPTFPKNTGISS